jgi:hypothetical protein
MTIGEGEKKCRTGEPKRDRRSRSPPSKLWKFQIGQLLGHGNDWSFSILNNSTGSPKMRYEIVITHKKNELQLNSVVETNHTLIGLDEHHTTAKLSCWRFSCGCKYTRKQCGGKLGLPSTLDTQTREKCLKYFCWCPCPAWLDLQRRQPKYDGDLGCEFLKHGLKQLFIWANNEWNGKEET